MAGIVFLKTARLDDMRSFYVERVEMSVWLEQADCVVLRHGNMLVGFCDRDEADTGGVIGLFYPGRADVDRMYERFQELAEDAPQQNDKYGIYHFFARDPEGRTLEFQCFLHPVAPHTAGDELVVGRRSIRRFAIAPVDNEVLWKVFEMCRYAPSARNSQPCYFRVVRDRVKLDALASVREESSAPIGRAPLAVAVVADPERSGRHVQDGCIMAYHFMMAAWLHGLGTCWIGGMDRAEVKRILGVPYEQCVTTVTPVGYPAQPGVTRDRRPARDFVRFDGE